jgi:hypothetical protein
MQIVSIERPVSRTLVERVVIEALSYFDWYALLTMMEAVVV